MISVEGLVVRRGSRTIIRDFALQAERGAIGIVGKNGCGKSTLLMALAGVLAPTEGRVLIDKHDVWGTSVHRKAARRALGYVPEAADPPGFLLGGELWSLVSHVRDDAKPTSELEAALGMAELRELALDRMSLGQRRRAVIAAAMIGAPRVLILDEPDNGLDGKHAATLIELLKSHVAENAIAIVATHDRELLNRIDARVVEL